jgi:hypothetical protein
MTAPEPRPAEGSAWSWWDDVLWPVLAGSVTAGGLLCALLSWGPVRMGTTLFCLGLGLMPLAWTVGESSRSRTPAWAVATLTPTWAVGVLAVAGLCSALGGWSLLAPLAVILTAPPVRTRTARTGAWVRRTAQIVRTRRAFHQIITHGG